MLVLSRKVGQKIVIGDQQIEVVVLGVQKGKVRLGFNCPPEVTVHREEVLQRLQEGQQQAGQYVELELTGQG